jgi:hypothetical protein
VFTNGLLGIPVYPLRTCWPPSPCAGLSPARTTTEPQPHPAPSTDDASIPRLWADPEPWERHGTVPVFTVNRSISPAPSFAPAASPRLRRRPSPWPPHRQVDPPTGQIAHCTPAPCPPGLSRCHAYGALPLVPLVCPLISLADPDPSGSPGSSRLCQRCFPPSPTSPGSDCAQLPPGCCDSPARRSCTSLDSQASRRTSASWRTARSNIPAHPRTPRHTHLRAHPHQSETASPDDNRILIPGRRSDLRQGLLTRE